jgi:hypothetical protein
VPFSCLSWGPLAVDRFPRTPYVDAYNGRYSSWIFARFGSRVEWIRAGRQCGGRGEVSMRHKVSKLSDCRGSNARAALIESGERVMHDVNTGRAVMGVRSTVGTTGRRMAAAADGNPVGVLGVATGFVQAVTSEVAVGRRTDHPRRAATPSTPPAGSSTTVAAASNGAALPQGTRSTVASTAGFVAQRTRASRSRPRPACENGLLQREPTRLDHLHHLHRLGTGTMSTGGYRVLGNAVDQFNVYTLDQRRRGLDRPNVADRRNRRAVGRPRHCLDRHGHHHVLGLITYMQAAAPTGTFSASPSASAAAGTATYSSNQLELHHRRPSPTPPEPVQNHGRRRYRSSAASPTPDVYQPLSGCRLGAERPWHLGVSPPPSSWHLSLHPGPRRRGRRRPHRHRRSTPAASPPSHRSPPGPPSTA